MRAVCLGGGPGGLYFAISLKRRDPAHEVVVIERNRPDDTFGWGVVLSDETLADIFKPMIRKAPRSFVSSFVYWDDIAVHYRGKSGAFRRSRVFWYWAQTACSTSFSSVHCAPGSGSNSRQRPRKFRLCRFDLIVGADGVNSRVRAALPTYSSPTSTCAPANTFGSARTRKFDDAFTFIFEQTEHWLDLGACLPVRCRYRDLYRRMLGRDLAACRLRPDERRGDDCGLRESFLPQSRCQQLMSNARSFARLGLAQLQSCPLRALEPQECCLARRCRRNSTFLRRLGLEAGSGKRDCAAGYLQEEAIMADAFRRYEDERRLEVLRLQSAARNSTEWFEHVERYLNLDPVQFNYSLLTRSQRIRHENLRERDWKWLGDAERWFERKATGGEPQQAGHRCSCRSACAVLS